MRFIAEVPESFRNTYDQDLEDLRAVFVNVPLRPRPEPGSITPDAWLDAIEAELNG